MLGRCHVLYPLRVKSMMTVSYVIVLQDDRNDLSNVPIVILTLSNDVRPDKDEFKRAEAEAGSILA
jgi:hypothetical protein